VSTSGVASSMVLDRMVIEEAGPDPAAIAAAVHRQLGPPVGAVPVHTIALALDIVEIREKPLHSIEGALVMPDNRKIGSIAVNLASNPRRRRFTIAHELGHFLSIHHRPAGAGGFTCTSSDLRGSLLASEMTRHARQEVEANRFAIELLAPVEAFAAVAEDIPDLQHVLDLAARLDLSREACARRYVELQHWPCAVVFTKDGAVDYASCNALFPAAPPGRGVRLPLPDWHAQNEGLGPLLEVKPSDWLARGSAQQLGAQTLQQMNGRATTLLVAEPAEEAA
jgi:hypothetical protein